MSEVVIYTNQEGIKEFRRVPEGTLPIHYGQGVWIGPPSLDDLSLSKKQKQDVNNFLVEQGIVTYENLLGKKRLVLNFLVELGLKESKAAQIRNNIIGSYQSELIELTMENK